MLFRSINEPTVRLTVSRGREVVIRNDNLNEGLYLFKYHEEYKVYKVDATEESKKLGNPKVFNLIVLGVAAQHMDFSIWSVDWPCCWLVFWPG